MKLVNLIKIVKICVNLEILLKECEQDINVDSTEEVYLRCAHNDLTYLIENVVEKEVENYENN